MTNEINDTMIKDYRKRNNPLKPIAQASEFYVPGIKDTITKTTEGLDTFKDWSDLDLLNNKEGREELGIAKGTLLSGNTDGYVPRYIWKFIPDTTNHGRC